MSALFIFHISSSELGVVDFMDWSSLGPIFQPGASMYVIQNKCIYMDGCKYMYMHIGYRLTCLKG
jgi:hypothetical protein